MNCASVVLLLLAGCAQKPDPYAPVAPIIARHCVTCHANHPTHPGFDSPPLGVVLDSPADVKKHAIRIKMLAVTTDVMPLGNETGMTGAERSEEHTSELQSLMRISYAVFCLKKNTQNLNELHTKSK